MEWTEAELKFFAWFHRLDVRCLLAPLLDLIKLHRGNARSENFRNWNTDDFMTVVRPPTAHPEDPEPPWPWANSAEFEEFKSKVKRLRPILRIADEELRLLDALDKRRSVANEKTIAWPWGPADQFQLVVEEIQLNVRPTIE